MARHEKTVAIKMAMKHIMCVINGQYRRYNAAFRTDRKSSISSQFRYIGRGYIVECNKDGYTYSEQQFNFYITKKHGKRKQKLRC